MYKLHLERQIAIAHQLKYHTGKCKNLHGHNLRIIVDIDASELIKEGSSMNMVVDFGDIKKLIDSLDHCYINDKFKTEHPTAEFLSSHLATSIYWNSANKSIQKVSVIIYEADGQYAQYIYKGEEL